MHGAREIVDLLSRYQPQRDDVHHEVPDHLVSPAAATTADTSLPAPADFSKPLPEMTKEEDMPKRSSHPFSFQKKAERAATEHKMESITTEEGDYVTTTVKTVWRDGEFVKVSMTQRNIWQEDFLEQVDFSFTNKRSKRINIFFLYVLFAFI